MKLDIELLNRIMSDIFPKSYFSKVIEVLDLNLKIGEVCRRYSEEVNKKPDTKTAEELFIDTLKTYLSVIESKEEYAATLKKRIEELEDLLNSVQGILENEGYVTKVAEIERAINPSTNGK